MVLSIIDNVVNWFNGLDKTNLVSNILFYGSIILSLLSFSGKVKDALSKQKEKILEKFIEKTEKVESGISNIQDSLIKQKEETQNQLDKLREDLEKVNQNLTSIMEADPLAKVKYSNIEKIETQTLNNINKCEEIVVEPVKEEKVEEVKQETKTTKLTTSYIE